MLGKNRNRDLLEIFDDTWKANHNEDVKNAKAKEKKFINKMFNVNEKVSEKEEFSANSIPVKPKKEAERISKQIDRTIKVEKQNDVRNIINRYK